MTTASRADGSCQRVAVVGGGLAGMAAALRLAEAGLTVELFEARRVLGGRAASFRDPASGELIDHCQHVGMACCTNFRDFCERSGIAGDFDRFDVLHFFGPEGTRYDLRASKWLPAPLHLAPALLRQGYLPWRDRLAIGRTMVKLARLREEASADAISIGEWLRKEGASELALRRFWSVVLVSALGETLGAASLLAARKVFVDGFLAHRTCYQVDVPRRSLRELFDGAAAKRLEELGVKLSRGTPVERVCGTARRVCGVVAQGQERRYDALVLATTWRQVASLLSDELHAALPDVAAAESFDASPISGVHLWFDRPITPLPHAVLVDRLSQWVFRRPVGEGGHYYQVVISASRDLKSLAAGEVIAAVLDDLRQVFPDACGAKLVAHKIVTEKEAVFSYRPGLDDARPLQTTAAENLFLAGDWTATGWPSTLEGAVRSGYLAAEGVLSFAGRSARLLAPDLPRGRLVRWLAGIV